jgi:putative transposase
MDIKKMFTQTLPEWTKDVPFQITSKTHPETDEVKKVGSVKRIKLLNRKWINRGIVGACNVLLRALVDQPHKVTWQLADVNKINCC